MSLNKMQKYCDVELVFVMHDPVDKERIKFEECYSRICAENGFVLKHYQWTIGAAEVCITFRGPMSNLIPVTNKLGPTFIEVYGDEETVKERLKSECIPVKQTLILHPIPIPVEPTSDDDDDDDDDDEEVDDNPKDDNPKDDNKPTEPKPQSPRSDS